MMKSTLMQKVFEALEVGNFTNGLCIDDKTNLITIEDFDGKKFKLVAVEVEA